MAEYTATKAFILAGGKSKRFGQDKSLFPYQGKPLIQHVFDTLKDIFDDIAIIGESPEKYPFLKVPVFSDIIPGFGPLGGIYTALHQSQNARAFILACDMPSLSSQFIEYMKSIPDQYDLIIPVIRGYYEPLHAIYTEKCLPFLKECIDTGEKKITCFFNRINIRAVHEDEIIHYGDPDLIFRNINYLKDV